MTCAVISGTGIYCPPHSISNGELVESFNQYVDAQNALHAADIAAGNRQPLARSSVEFIEKNSGIRQRYVLDKEGVLDPARMYPRFEERPADQLSLMAEIAVHAARQAMAQAGKSADDIDAVLCCAANMQRAYPAMAIEIQKALGVRGYAYDMNVACSSATFGIEQASNAILAGRAKCVLMVNPEITSAHLEWRERDCHFIFGDVCTAVIIESSETATSPDQWEILGTRLATEFSNNIRNDFGFMNRCEDADPEARNKTFRQEGRKVFTEVVPIAVAHIESQLSELGLKPGQLQRYWLHQANEGMNQQVIKKMVGGQAGDGLAPLILGDYANTASAGSIIAFHHHRADLQAGDLGVVCSFGAGYSVGSIVVRKRTESVGAAGQGFLHPLLQVDASDHEGFAFTARLSGQEFFLADHVVKGQRVLPAAAHLEMAHAGVQRILGPIIPKGVQAGVTLTCVVFASAAVADGPLNLKMTLAPDHRAGIGFEIHGHSKTGPAMLLSQGRATVASQRPPPRCDVNAIRLGATLRTLRVEQCYQAFSAMGLDYGQGHRTIDHIEAGTDAQGRPIAMAQLVLPHSLKAGHGAFVLHPGLLDGALQAGLSLVFEAKGADAYAGGLCLPYAIDQVEIFGPLPERAQAIARIDHDEGHATSCRLSIEVVTTEGDVRVRVQGLSVRLLNIGAGATDASRAEALTLVPCWRPFTPDMRPPPSGLDVRRVIVHAQDDEASCANLRHHHPGATLVGVSCADETPHLTQALDRCGDIAELVWIPGVAGAASATLGFRLIKALLALGHEARPLSLTVVTTQGQAIGADEAIRPDHAALHGLVGSLAKEFVQWRIRLVDVAEGDVPPWSHIASLPPDESGHPVLYRFGQWYEPRTTRVKLPNLVKPSGFRRGGVYVLLGGAGGLGEVLTKHLVQHHAAQVVWVGRRPEDDGIATRCDRIAVHGPRPHYVCADATDLPALQAAYRSIRTRFGAIHGVVHATIQLQDNSLARMDEASFESVLSAKAQVCLNAAEVFAAEPLDFVLFFSSVQSLAKLPGQANYAAGCTFADAHAHALAQARPDWRIKVVNWGYWGDVGIVASPVYRQRMAQAGIESIAADEGLALIEQLLSSPLRQVVYLKASKAVVAEQLGVLPEVGIRACELEVAAQPVSPGPSTLPIPVDPSEALAQSREFDRALCGVLRAQLLASGLFEGGRIEADAWRKKPRSPALCDRWMAQSLRILQGQDAHVSDAWQAWESGMPRWRADPHRRAQVLLADACLRALPAILRGDVRSTDVIFPDSSMSLVEGIYKHNPVADYFNAVLGESLLSHMTACLEADPSATFRIAEIGAGTGGTSALMFDLLKPFAHVVQEYRYTDISKAFLLHAHQHYAQKAPYLATSLFNVALPLDGQDLAAGVYDVVIATNVLHATQDIRRTLRHAKALLKKGGSLLLNEIVGGSVFTHLTFGLMDGWWAYQDEALRCLGAPALSPQGWVRALQDEGFERISHPASLAHGLGQQVVVAFSDGLVQTSWSSASSTPSPSSPLSKTAVAPSLIFD